MDAIGMLDIRVNREHCACCKTRSGHLAWQCGCREETYLNVLVLCNHFIRHVMAYVTPDQTAKTVAKFLWQGYILIFRALAKFLSDWGANFESNIISELCELMGIWITRTLPYHSQANRQVEWAHQGLMQMIGKLSKDQKANWPKHPLELVQAYNSMRLAITWCNPHYLMLGQWPCLPILLFSHHHVHRKHQHVNHYVADLCEWLHKAFKEAQAQSTVEAERQMQYYDCKANAISLEPGNLFLAKANAYKGRRKVKDQWEEEPYKVKCRIAEGIPSYLMKNQQTGCSSVLHQNHLFLITPIMGAPLCSGVWAEWTRCMTTMLKEPTWKANENEKAPQSLYCLPLAQCHTGETPLGWVNRKLCAFLRTFSWASLLDQGWKVQCRGKGDVQTSMLAFWRQMYWSHWWSLKDMTNHTFFNPTSLHYRDCKLKTWGYEMGTLAHASICGMIILSWPQMLRKLLVFPTLGTPTVVTLTQWDKRLLHKLTWNLGGNDWEGVGISHPPQFESVMPFGLSNMGNIWHKRQNIV